MSEGFALEIGSMQMCFWDLKAAGSGLEVPTARGCWQKQLPIVVAGSGSLGLALPRLLDFHVQGLRVGVQRIGLYQ